MDKHTSDLLSQLASQLNVTIEHLWAVLVKQAFIYGITGLLWLALTPFMVFGCYLLWRMFFKLVKDSNGWDETSYIWPAVVTLIVIVIIIVDFLSLDMLIAAFINPEYWALKQIIK